MEWTEDMSAGVAAIDEQHKELFKRINNLVAAIKEHRCKAEIDGTIKFLDNYARFHFTDEEQLMEDALYNGLDEHRRDHAVYLQNIQELKHQASLPRVQGMSYELSVTANQIVVDWIIDHIMKVDKKFGVFLKVKQPS